MLVQVHNKEVLAIPNLLRYVCKFIYDEKNMSVADIRRMQQSIIDWSSAITIEKDKLKQVQQIDILLHGEVVNNIHKYSEEEESLRLMAIMLKENGEGLLDNRKALFLKHGIDYRKFHRFPEAYTLQDFINAEKLVEESNAREGIINGNHKN